VNIVTREPFESRGTYLRAAAGSQGMGQTLVRHGGELGQAQYRLSLSHRRDEGFDDLDDRRRVSKASLRAGFGGARDAFDLQLGYTEGANGAFGDEGSLVNPIRDRDVRDHFQYLRWTRRRSMGSEFY